MQNDDAYAKLLIYATLGVSQADTRYRTTSIHTFHEWLLDYLTEKTGDGEQVLEAFRNDVGHEGSPNVAAIFNEIAGDKFTFDDLACGANAIMAIGDFNLKVHFRDGDVDVDLVPAEYFSMPVFCAAVEAVINSETGTIDPTLGRCLTDYMKAGRDFRQSVKDWWPDQEVVTIFAAGGEGMYGRFGGQNVPGAWLDIREENMPELPKIDPREVGNLRELYSALAEEQQAIIVTEQRREAERTTNVIKSKANLIGLAGWIIGWVLVLAVLKKCVYNPIMRRKQNSKKMA